MAELMNKNKPIKDDSDQDCCSDSADSLDSEGYDKQDPYAATAKKIEKRNKMVTDFH